MHRTHDRLVTHTFLKQSCRFRNSNLHKPNDCLLCTQNIGSKNGNMVLQLVLPSNSNADNGTYLTSNSFEEILGGQNKSRSISGSQQEEYSTVGTECYVNQGFTNDLSEYGRNFAQTPVSLASTPDQVKSTSLEDKKQNFR
jgi:hypothetical protein